MSRIGKQPVDIPAGITVTADENSVFVKGPLGELSMPILGPVQAKVNDGKVNVTREDDSRESKSFHGMTRSLIANMVEGVSKGFTKELDIQGIGFKASVQGQKLVMSLGFSVPIEYEVPEGIKVTVEGGTSIVVSGVDKQTVCDAAARIRSFFPAEPYKGKGVRYRNEHVRRKVGKTVA